VCPHVRFKATNRDLGGSDSGRGNSSDNRSRGRRRRCRNNARRASHTYCRFLGFGRITRLRLDRVRRLGVEPGRAVRLRHRFLRISNSRSEGQSRQQVPQKLAV
jgi:hypothetical protein